jgi:serine phosphatase RsbU (regulator of sigma subunit)
MDQKNLGWAAVGAAFALFAAVDLLVLLVYNASGGLAAIVPPTVAGVVVLVTLPSLLSLYQTQQDRIDRQRRQIATLHAMDTAIAAELEIAPLLQVAVRHATRATDAEMGGIVLLADNGEEAPPVEGEAYANVPEERRDAFRAALMSATDVSEQWEIVRMPLPGGEGTRGFVGAARSAGSRPFSPEEVSLLTDLAGTVVVAVKNARRLREARDTAQALARERRVTEAFQTGLLPEVPPRGGPFAFAHMYEAHSDESMVGGDIYDLFPLDDERRWSVVIADVSGKGLAAARQTAMVKYALRSYAREHDSPAAVLQRLNNALCDEPALTGLVTLVYGVLRAEDGSFAYASAGHETPILVRADGAIETLEPTGPVLGAMRDIPYEEGAVLLHPGDGLLLYTDGLSEARSSDGTFLDVDGVARLLVELRDQPPAAIPEALLSAVRGYCDGKLHDDTAMLWIERWD